MLLFLKIIVNKVINIMPPKISITELQTNRCKRNTATIAVTAFRLMANKLVSNFLLHGSVFFLADFFQLLFIIAIFDILACGHLLIIAVFHFYQFLSFTMLILYQIFKYLSMDFFMNFLFIHICYIRTIILYPSSFSAFSIDITSAW